VTLEERIEELSQAAALAVQECVRGMMLTPPTHTQAQLDLAFDDNAAVRAFKREWYKRHAKDNVSPKDVVP